MNYSQLHQAVQTAAGLRLRLQPLYGQGEIVFPCTVAGGKYQMSKRRIPGYSEPVDCAVLDSVQSQANRMEEALLGDIRASNNLYIPHVETDFSAMQGLEKPVGKITCFEAPHRVFDAIFRDSVDGQGTHFPLTSTGKHLSKATAKDARPIFKISPASVLFGSWDSTGISGGLGEKFARCVVSEVVGINAERVTFRAGTRIDPLNAAKAAKPQEILAQTPDEIWNRLGKSGKDLNEPSGIVHGSIPWDGKDKKSGEMHGGVSCDYIQLSTTISFPALRVLGFPAENTEASSRAHAVLAAMALHAAALNVERGWHLRSRCDLVLEEGGRIEWELLGAAKPVREAVTSDSTRKLLKDAIQEAVKAGLPWHTEPVHLTPSPALQQLVIKSQQAHRTAPAGD